MNLYIFIKDNQIDGHPVLEENLMQVVPNFDPENLPSFLKKFERLEQPGPSGPYVHVRSRYEMYGDIVRDVFYEEPYTEEEKREKIQMQTQEPVPGFIFNEELCVWEPEVPAPEDGKPYHYDAEQRVWIELPPDQIKKD